MPAPIRVVVEGFEPPQVETNRFTVCRDSPNFAVLPYESLVPDSNQRLRDYKSRVLPTELTGQI